MTKFYTVADTEISHVDGINIVKELVETLKQMQNSLMIIGQRFPQTGSCVGQCSQVESLAILSPLPCHDDILPPSSGRCSSMPVCSSLRRHGHVDQPLCLTYPFQLFILNIQCIIIIIDMYES